MHDCSETREQITELVLDGGRQDEVLQIELNRCAECRAEFDALSATLRITTRLKETAAPTESYWAGYHARLRQKIQNSERDFDAKAQRRKAEFFLAPLRLCVRTTVPVPVPLIVAVVVLLAAIVLGTKQSAPQSPTIVHVPVEVPVVQEKEKIVTRVVYRERRSPARTSRRTTEPRVESTFAKFKPTDEVKLTVIKGGSPYEK